MRHHFYGVFITPIPFNVAVHSVFICCLAIVILEFWISTIGNEVLNTFKEAISGSCMKCSLTILIFEIWISSIWG